MPDYLPEVITHTAEDNLITVPHSENAVFSCHGSKFKTFPSDNVIKTVCENGNFKIENTSLILHVSELGCQADFFEDVLHYVKYCNNTLQGRSYQFRNPTLSSVEHLAEICYDAEEKRTVFIHMTPRMNNNIEVDAHQDKHNKVSMLENFSKMFDISSKVESEQVYYDEHSMNKKMKMLFGLKTFNFADQSVGVAKLLHPQYFYNQKKRITNFSSNKVGMWKSVLDGNYKNIQQDIINEFCFNQSDSFEIYAGTHGVLNLLTEEGHHEVFLKPGRKFPIPKFVYNIVYSQSQRKGIALIVSNNPFISISEVRNTVFCPSICSQIPWLKNLLRNNNYERPSYGLTFCCDIHSFSATVLDGPNLIFDVFTGERGLLKV